MTASIQTVWHVNIQALFRVVRATASHTVVVGELRVASVQTPAVTSSRNSLGHTRTTESLAAQELLLDALLSVVQAAVQVTSAIAVAVANSIGNILGHMGTAPTFARGRAYGAFSADVKVSVRMVTYVLCAVKRPCPAMILVRAVKVLGAVLRLGTLLRALVLRIHRSIP